MVLSTTTIASLPAVSCRRILALDLAFATAVLPERHRRDPVLVAFLPLHGAIDHHHRLIACGQLPDHRGVARAFLPAHDAPDVLRGDARFPLRWPALVPADPDAVRNGFELHALWSGQRQHQRDGNAVRQAKRPAVAVLRRYLIQRVVCASTCG